MMYFVDFGNGNYERISAATLSDVKEVVNDMIGYNQSDVIIYDDDSMREICRREWWGVKYNSNEYPPEIDPICYGDFGYYGDWTTEYAD